MHIHDVITIIPNTFNPSFSTLDVHNTCLLGSHLLVVLSYFSKCLLCVVGLPFSSTHEQCHLSPANRTFTWVRPLLTLPPQNTWSTECVATVSAHRAIQSLHADSTLFLISRTHSSSYMLRGQKKIVLSWTLHAGIAKTLNTSTEGAWEDRLLVALCKTSTKACSCYQQSDINKT